MRKQLTEAMIERLAPPPSGRTEIFDTFTPGLALRVTSNGAKSFVVRARIRGQSAPIRVTVGDARGMKLTDAREAARETLRACRAGEDPRPKPEAMAESPDALRWERVVETFIAKHARGNDRSKPNTRSWRQTEALISRYTTAWRGKLVGEITRADVVALLDQCEQVSIYRANRVLAAIRKLFNWAVLRGLVDSSPIVAGMAREGEVSRERFLTFDEIRLVWRAAQRLGQPFGPMFQFLLTVGQRRGEVVNAEWPSFDLESERLWTLKPEETKAGRTHLVPLSNLALSILEAQPRIDDPDLAEEAARKGLNRSSAVYVFTTTGRTPVSGFSNAKEHLDAAMLAILKEDAGENAADVEAPPAWRVHDLRRTVATHMEDALGIPPHIVGSILNHAAGSYKGVTAVYTRGTLIYERRRALVAWARLLGLAVAGGAAWEHIARALRPETEADAARTEEFRRMAQADEETWKAYLARISPTPKAKAA
jgi:integrase